MTPRRSGPPTPVAPAGWCRRRDFLGRGGRPAPSPLPPPGGEGQGEGGEGPHTLFHLEKIRSSSFCAADAAASGPISPRATRANIVGMTNVLKTSSVAGVA